MAASIPGKSPNSRFMEHAMSTSEGLVSFANKLPEMASFVVTQEGYFRAEFSGGHVGHAAHISDDELNESLKNVSVQIELVVKGRFNNGKVEIKSGISISKGKLSVNLKSVEDKENGKLLVKAGRMFVLNAQREITLDDINFTNITWEKG